MASERALRRRGLILVLAGTVVWSLAGFFARLLAHLDVWTVLGWRAAFGFLSISVIGAKTAAMRPLSFMETRVISRPRALTASRASAKGRAPEATNAPYSPRL